MGNDILMTQKQVVPLIRLSEVYLIAMEAAPTLEEANRLYTEYMRARDVMVVDPLEESEVASTIEKEYRIEFWGEGQMFYYYKRHHTTRMKWKADREVTETDYIVPLPENEIRAN